MHRVAVMLGMTVSDLSERITLRELVDWMRYEQGPRKAPPVTLDGMSSDAIEELLNAGE